MSLEDSVVAKFFELTELLYKTDVANTSCAENAAFDEYDKEAHYIVVNNLYTKEDVAKVFDEAFGDDYNREALDNIFPTIKRIVLS